MSELFRRFRWWCWNEDRYPFRRCWLRRWLSNRLRDFAAWRSKDARWCWATAATWSMGFDNPLLGPVDSGCNWCGKCGKRKSLTTGREGT